MPIFRLFQLKYRQQPRHGCILACISMGVLFQYAVMYGCEELLHALLTAGADMDHRSALHTGNNKHNHTRVLENCHIIFENQHFSQIQPPMKPRQSRGSIDGLIFLKY